MVMYMRMSRGVSGSQELVECGNGSQGSKIREVESWSCSESRSKEHDIMWE
jgi:hypothetical protein